MVQKLEINFMVKFLISNLFSLVFNLTLLFILIIGIQNNHDKKSVDFYLYSTVELPVGFIAGSSFISGSFYGNLLFLILNKKD